MSIDDVTKKEEALLRKSICPDCGYDKFREGPCGGASVNVMCANDKCKARFNICGPFTPQRLEYGSMRKTEEQAEKDAAATANQFDRFDIIDFD